jgi:hypothetical protein
MMAAGRKYEVEAPGMHAVVVMDSIAYVDASDVGRTVVAGSHGGRSSGRFAVEYPLNMCFLNDAGVGKDGAGIAALTLFDALGRAGATYDSATARIGDATDAWEHGIVSYVSSRAALLGFRAGERIRDAVCRVFGPDAAPTGHDDAPGPKTRVPLRAGLDAILMDSTAFADPSDAGHVVVAGSHGGLAGKYADEIRLAAIFINDAGGGKDDAGFSSLAVYDAIGVPAAAYSHRSARIGDVQDAWENGIVSVVNRTAAALGIMTSEPVQVAIRRVFGAPASR